MPISLELDDLDLILARKRILRDSVSTTFSDPPVSEIVRAHIESIARDRSAFVFNCVCGMEVSTTSRTGKCPACQTEFDLSAF